jgi:hypothetical protein
VKKKPRASAKRTKRATRKPHVLSDAMRADDEKLREKLRRANMRKFDEVLGTAMRPGRA